MPTVPSKADPRVDFIGEDETNLHGCFSPCGRPCPSSLPAVSDVSTSEAIVEVVAPAFTNHTRALGVVWETRFASLYGASRGGLARDLGAHTTTVGAQSATRLCGAWRVAHYCLSLA